MEHLVINLTSLTCYLVCALNIPYMLFSMCIQKKVLCLKKEKDKHKNTTHGVEQYQELFHMLPAN